MVGDILQPTHLIFVLVVALLVLGPKRLPEVARSLGNSLRDFRSAISGESRDDHDDDDDHQDRQAIAAASEDGELDHMRIYSEHAKDETEAEQVEEHAEAVAPAQAGDEHKQPAAQADKPA